MLEFLQNIDSDLMLGINRLHCAVADTFMYTFSGRWIWIPFYAALLVMLMRRYGWRNALGFTLVVVAIIAVSDQLCATVIRPAVERLRPANPDNPLSAAVHIVNGYRGGAFGFPSCHAANTIALATFMTLLTRSRWLGWCTMLWAAMNCYSRIYLGVHYPGDILVGALIGAGVAWTAYAAVRYYVNMPDIRGERFTRLPVAVCALTAAGILLYAILQ